MKLRIAKLRDVTTPTRSHEYDAGLDFYIPNDIGWDTKTITPGSQILLPTGIKADIPEGFGLFCFERSSMASKGLIIGARVVDAEYQGEIHMHCINVGKEDVHLKPGLKLCQFVLSPVVHTKVVVVELDQLYNEITERADGKFGSTGTGLAPRKDYKFSQFEDNNPLDHGAYPLVTKQTKSGKTIRLKKRKQSTKPSKGADEEHE